MDIITLGIYIAIVLACGVIGAIVDMTINYYEENK